MALNLLLSTGTVSATGSSLTLTDLTGAYQATDNPGGYGTPNAQRSSLFLLCVAFRLSTPDEVLPVAVNVYNGLTATSWVIPTLSDGVYRVQLIPVSAVLPTVTFVAGTIYYADGKIYRTITADTLVGAEVLLDLTLEFPPTVGQVTDLLAALGTTSDELRYYLLDRRYQLRRAKVIRLLSEFLLDGCCTNKALQNKLDDLRLFRESAEIAYWADKPFDVALKMESIETIYASIPELATT